MFSKFSLSRASTSLYSRTNPTRGFAQITHECAEHLKRLGITNKHIVYQPTYVIPSLNSLVALFHNFKFNDSHH